MKVFHRFIIVLTVLSAISCETSNNTQQAERRPAINIVFLTPDDIVGKNLVGTDKDGDFMFVFKEKNILEYKINGKTYIGDWSFQDTSLIMRYTINWTDEKKQGYGIDIVQTDSGIKMYGYWYLTDVMIRFDKTVKIME